MDYKLYEKYGPIISDDESELIFNELNHLVSEGKAVNIKFDGVIAMTTRSAKRIFGTLHSNLKSEKFYNLIRIENASNTLQEIIYDSIINYISNTEIKG